ncbi:hypothetical protein DFJ58DRAFT_731570 [Suillus subalutaceus]|uniref:uncharacterized protein n=1 Tax=Suillus subalutaceus TaxID=48586 RepID=UPI001B86E9B2|nr:uncharacterized protein DFJ58DRAFT_731570 [Suillus subalutaceus]KAG1843455.1 hypothetical protein DFJ58DRAFT_731570 [Suillus subalutaceus]
MDIDQAGIRFLCVCTKYNHGQPHEVSYTSQYHHLNEATTKEEKEKMHTVKAFGLKVLTVSDPPSQASGPGSSRYPAIPADDAREMSLSDGARRAVTLQVLVKQAHKCADSQHFVGRCKRAKIVEPEQTCPDDEPPLPPDIKTPLPSPKMNLLSLPTSKLRSLPKMNLLSLPTSKLRSLPTSKLRSPPENEPPLPPDIKTPLPPENEPPLPPDNKPPLPPEHECPQIELLQALYRDPESAFHMQYLWERTQEVLDGLRQTGNVPVVDDIAMGFDILGAVLDAIREQDIRLLDLYMGHS